LVLIAAYAAGLGLFTVMEKVVLMLTNVPTGHMIVTLMPTVTILRAPTHARANQHISEMENTAQVSGDLVHPLFLATSIAKIIRRS